MEIYDILIIGGGVVGASIARELSRYKLRIGLLEKEEELAFGVSKSNSGIIHPGTQNSSNSLKGKLCVAGNILTRKICQELGVEFKEVGELIVAFNEAEKKELQKIKKEADYLKVPELRIVDSAWLRKQEPNLNHEALCALYAPTAGIISPYRMVYALSENAAKNGVIIHTNTKVENINVVKKDPKDKGNFEVNSNNGLFKSRYIINAAGLFADDISGMVDVKDFKIKPIKGEEFLLDKKREHMTNHLLFPIPSKISKGILIIKTSDGNPMIGPTAEEVEEKEILETTGSGLGKVLVAVQKMIPSIKADDIIAYFAGLRPVCGGDFIIRYENNVPGFINVAGIQSPGLTSAPAIALMVKDILINNGMVLKKKLFFKQNRKKTNHLFAMSGLKIKKLIEKNAAYGDIICRCEMVSRKEIEDAIDRGATTLDGIKFRTRAQAGRCHGGFCTTRILKILAEKTGKSVVELTKRGSGSEVVKGDRRDE